MSGAIDLRPQGNEQVGHYFLSLHTGKRFIETTRWYCPWVMVEQLFSQNIGYMQQYACHKSLMTGHSIHHIKQMLLLFGAYVQVHEEHPDSTAT